jgi:hypothetical protein
VSQVTERWRERLDEAVSSARRTTPGPLLVRVGVFLAGAVGLLVAWPLELVIGPGFLVALVLAAMTALFPRGRLTTGVILVAVVGWEVGALGYGESPTYVRVIVVATALYLQHNLAALAAVLPYDAIIGPGVLLRWLGRAVAVVALTAALGLFAVVAPLYVSGRYLVASLAGLALMGLIVAYLARLVGRR